MPLAPDVYLGLCSGGPTANGVELTGEDDPQAIDVVIEMRRYAESHTLAARLERGKLARVRGRGRTRAISCWGRGQ